MTLKPWPMRRCLSTFALTVCTIAAMAQQATDTPANDGGVARISKAGSDQYVMQFTEYDFGTLYLDFPVSIPTGKDGVRGVYYISSIEGNDAITTRIRGNIPANTAVMVHGNHNETYTFERTDANVKPIEGNLLRGSLVDIPVADALAEAGASSNAVLLTYGKPKETGYMGFYRYTGKTLKANKAFLIYEPSDGSTHDHGIGRRCGCNRRGAGTHHSRCVAYPTGHPSQHGSYPKRNLYPQRQDRSGHPLNRLDHDDQKIPPTRHLRG